MASSIATILVGRESGSAVAGGSGQPERIPALTRTAIPGANVSGDAHAQGVTAGRDRHPSCSEYLLRPLRTYEQALADIAAKEVRHA